MIDANGVSLTAPIANNNALGGPRRGLVPPDEIARVDVMCGPFSAAYPGNSMGAVLQLTTRQPDSLEASIQQTGAAQQFSLYATTRTFGTARTSAAVGDRFGKFSFWAAARSESSANVPKWRARRRQPARPKVFPVSSVPAADVHREPEVLAVRRVEA